MPRVKTCFIYRGSLARATWRSSCWLKDGLLWKKSSRSFASLSRLGRIFCLPGRTDSFAPMREPILHGSMPHHWKAIVLPRAHSADDDKQITQTLPFEIKGLELRECAAFGNEVKRFGQQQFARVKKFFGRNLRRRN